MRNVELCYKILDKKRKAVCFTMKDIYDGECKIINRVYIISKLEESELYNKILDDFNCEFDNNVSDGMYMLVSQLYKKEIK